MLSLSIFGRRKTNRHRVEDFEPRDDIFEGREGREVEEQNSHEAGVRLKPLHRMRVLEDHAK